HHNKVGISFRLKDYLILVNETGRILREDKSGAISAKAESILARLNISDESWL
ncbi:MAG: hypothetical protein ACI9YP_001203, partial [Colwellia sp.]